MANVPEHQRITSEDFKQKDQELVAQMSDPINTYIEQLNEILNKNLTFSDNFRGELKTVEVVGGTPFTFKYSNLAKPVGLWIVDFSNLTTPAEVLTVAVQAHWSYDGKGNITLDTVTGLAVDDIYSLTIIAISG
jgi:hypothetical protein